MKKITIVMICCAGLAFTSAIMKEDGRAGATGSPGETTCNTSSCHTGNTVNAPGGSIVIDAPTMTGWEYIPGQVYPINVTVSRTGTSLFGFGFESLRSSGANAGTFAITNSIQTKLLSAVIGPNVRTNVVHKMNGGATANAHTFSFNWTAPVTGTGTITFYAAGNAANNNGTTSGDFIYSTSQIVTESTSGISDGANQFALQLYPVPVKDKLHIRFQLSEPSYLEIALVDLRGSTVAELMSQRLSQGAQQLTYDNLVNIPAGIYLLSMKINDQSLVKRIVVL